jgi:hypothetical protein
LNSGYKIYTNIKEWKQKPHGYIPTGRNLQLDVIVFVDDSVLLASTEDDMQCSIYNFHIVVSKYNMEISIEKSKVMVFCEKELVPSKICLNNKMIERTNDFTYLGDKLPFQGETDLSQEITKYKKKYGYHKCGFETNICTETYLNTPVQDLSMASPMLWK